MFAQKVENDLVLLSTPVQGNRRLGAETGSMYYYVGKEAPEGWLFCRGQSVLKKDYPELYSVIGDTYGSTATTFNLPDLRGYAPAGVGQSSRTDSTHDVYTLGQKKEAQIASHCHAQAAHTHSVGSHSHGFNHTHYMCHRHCVFGCYTALYNVCYESNCYTTSYGAGCLSNNLTFTTNCTITKNPTCSTSGTSSSACNLSTNSSTIENVAFGATSGGTHGNRVSLNVIIYTGD